MAQTSAGGRSSLAFWMLLALGAAFIWLSSAALPPVVAAHFAPGGAANGFMPQAAYRGSMVLLAIAIPALLFLLPDFVFRLPDQYINLPHRDYWLAPARRDASIGWFRGHSRVFAVMLLALFCYAHALVVLANRQTPAHLAEGAMLAGLAAFFLFVIVWIWALYRRFRAAS